MFRRVISKPTYNATQTTLGIIFGGLTMANSRPFYHNILHLSSANSLYCMYTQFEGIEKPAVYDVKAASVKCTWQPI